MKTKVYINLNNFKDEWLCATGELPAVVPFLSEEQQDKYLNRDDTPDSRKPVFQRVIEEAKQHIELTSLNDCDLVLLPFKYGHSDATSYIEEAKSAGKKIVVIFNDDSAEDIPLDDGVIILRTSFYKSKKKNNEYAMPPFSADFYDSTLTIMKEEKPTISFCGGITHPLRLQALKSLHESYNIESDFIIRNGFWAPGVNKDVAIKEFNENIQNSLYGFCCRGAGNFSFRFGEVLSHGRIPVLVDSDCVLPFEHKINWNEHAVIVSQNDVDNIENLLLEFHESKSSSQIMKMQEENRRLWKEYFTPLGFVEHLGEFVE
jgi:hypothetical protein